MKKISLFILAFVQILLIVGRRNVLATDGKGEDFNLKLTNKFTIAFSRDPSRIYKFTGKKPIFVPILFRNFHFVLLLLD